VTLAYSQIGLLAHLPWQVALGQKYFEEQGLEPKGYNFESGAKSIAALIGGSADFAANALEHAIKSPAIGAKLKPLGIVMDYSPPEKLLDEIRDEHRRVSDLASKSGLIR